MTITHLLNTAADFKRPVADYDDLGSPVYTLVQYSGSQLCRISPGVPGEVSRGPTQFAEATTTIYTIADVEVRRDDEVHHAGKVYKVLGTAEPSVSDQYLKLICEEVSVGA